MTSDSYVSLHTHSEFSQLDGFSQVEAIARRAALLGQSAVALTDHQECSGHIALEKACQKEEIKPIYGMEGYLVNEIDQARKEKWRPKQFSHFCVFAENQRGLKNLWSLSSMAFLKGFYHRALSDWEMLREYKDGLIVTDGCMLANMAEYIIEDKEDEALLWASKYLDIFGADSFFMELHTWQFINPQHEDQIQLNNKMTKVNLGKIEIANRLGIPLIVVNDAHYSNEEDWENHALFWTLSTKIDDNDRLENGKTAAWIMSSDEVRFWMSKHGVPTSITDEAIANTARIADRCDVEIERKLHVPVLTKSKEEELELFMNNLEKGFKEKVTDKGLDVPVYMERAEKECSLIIQRELPGYFNIVADYCQEFKNRGWLLAAGRGSSGGSLVAYLDNINELDPVARGLLFERFLNPGRLDYPDIDTDIPQSKRQEAIGYVESKYGADKVCRIGTFSRLGPKQVLNDLCRIMEIPFADHKAMTKIIEQVEKIQDDIPEDDEDSATRTWEEILETQESDLTPWVKKYPLLFIRMQNLIGLIRQSGTHASGIIISDESLIGQIPLRKKKDQPMTSQFDMYTLADLGFIKFDFLGVRNLDTLMEARSLVTGQRCDPKFFYDFNAEYTDSEIWEPIGRGETVGVFQVSTPAGTQLSKKIKPQNEYEIATLISIDRPGVTRTVGMTEEFIERRRGLRDIITPHPFMTQILEETYGIVVYQEQVLEIVRMLAGYSLEEADKIRSIVGKKKMDKMREEKPRFIRRCCENAEFVRLAEGRAAAKAEQCWNQIEQSGAYAFNKAHALGYSLLTCWGAWMRHYYPLQYLTACLMTDPDNLTTYVRDLKRIGFQVLPPDINESEERFTIVNGAVRYGLQDLKWVGASALAQITEHRPFKSLQNFLALVDKRACNKRVVETLIKIGAFDSMGDRYSLMRELYEVRREKEFVIPDFQDAAVIQAIELEIVGNYITEDPLDKYRDAIDSRCLKDPDQIDDLNEGEVIEIGGVLARVHEHNAKNGLMAFLEVEWEAQKFSVVCFADSYRDNKSLLQVDSPVIIRAIRGKKGVYLHNVIRLDYVSN